MILFVEGTRACGKTHLTKKFIESIKLEYPDADIEYYKFYFADHVKTLDLHRTEGTPAMHYFSLGNIMTILEMNKLNKRKVWVFDRAIVSAYVWAVLQNRLTLVWAKREYEALLKSDLFVNCKTLFVISGTDRSESDKLRNKDKFGGIHKTDEEFEMFSTFLQYGNLQLDEKSRGNEFEIVTNNYDEDSIATFILAGKKLLCITA